MYSALEDYWADDLFNNVVLPQTRHYDKSDRFDVIQRLGRDEYWDALKDPSAIGPRQTDLRVRPEKVAQVEVKTVRATTGSSSKGSRQEALAQLREQRDNLSLQGNAAIALVTQDGSVEYTVFDPTLRHVLYRRRIGSITNITPQHAEEGVRRLLNRVVKQQTGQRFPKQKRRRAGGQQTNKTANDQGPDLLPKEAHNQEISRRVYKEYQSRSPKVRQQSNQTQRLVQGQYSQGGPTQRPLSRPAQSRQSPQLQPARPAPLRLQRASPQQSQRARRQQRNRFDVFAEFF